MRPGGLRSKALFVAVSLISLATCLNWLFIIVSTNKNGHKPVLDAMAVDKKKNEHGSLLDAAAGAANEKKREFWRSFKPNWECPRELKSCVGKEHGDGGKWMCGLATLGRRNLAEGYNCTVYSFGVSGDSSFEAEVLQNTFCSVYAYDPSVVKIGRPLKTSNPRLRFQRLGIGGNDSGSSKTLKTLMAENGHKFADILKVDVEGAEFKSLGKMLEDFDELPFGQLLVELHTTWSSGTVSKLSIAGLLQALEKRGARIFSIEPNEESLGCAEFSLINLNYLKLFIPEKDL